MNGRCYEVPKKSAKGHNKQPTAAAAYNENCYLNLNGVGHMESESGLYVNGEGPYEELQLGTMDREHGSDVYTQLHQARSESSTDKSCQCFSCKRTVMKTVVMILTLVVVILFIVAMATAGLVLVINLLKNTVRLQEEVNNTNNETDYITHLVNRLEHLKTLLHPSFSLYKNCQGEVKWSSSSSSAQCSNNFATSPQWVCLSEHLPMDDPEYFMLDVRCMYHDSFGTASLSAMVYTNSLFGDEAYCQCSGTTTQTTLVNGIQYYQYNVTCGVILVRCPTDLLHAS